MTLRLSSLVLICVLLASCNKDPDEPDIVLPSNLQTNITIDEGRVEVTATAEKANFYTFTFYEGNDSTLIEAVDGRADYTYTTDGSHLLKARAHLSYADYIEVDEILEIALDPGFTGGIPTSGYSTPLSYPGYTLVWNDEFDGNALSSDWTHEIGNGNGGWGNNELQYYRPENTEVKDGLLIITAKQELVGGYNYSSSRIVTRGQQSFKHGRIDIRAALPYGKGMWPALWMLGDNFGSVGWPSCGEIDIMELVGGPGANDRTVHGTLHWDNNGSYASFGGSNTKSGGKFAEEFHVFSIIWDENSIKWLRDDVQYHITDVSPAAMSEFHQNFFFIFNVAVGGNWPGSPDASTVFPQAMAVDYVRVFQ